LTANDEQNFSPLKQADTLEFEPGSSWAYSNPAYDGLAIIIEKVSGMKWQAFVEKYIFQPSGMLHSEITDGAFPSKGVAHGYRKINNHFEQYDYGEFPTFTAAGNGGVWSSIEDLRRYVLAMKNCIFLDCNTIAFSQKVWRPGNWSGKDPPFMGFSWFVGESDSVFKYKSIHHSGGQGGFHAHLYMIPEPDITIIWLTNNDRSLTPLIMDPLIELGYIK
jgi:CubicO group peptidase (beta-lactamase class C family)